MAKGKKPANGQIDKPEYPEGTQAWEREESIECAPDESEAAAPANE